MLRTVALTASLFSIAAAIVLAQEKPNPPMLDQDKKLPPVLG